MRALTHARVVQPLCSDSGQAPNPHSNYRGPCSDVWGRMHSVARARMAVLRAVGVLLLASASKTKPPRRGPARKTAALRWRSRRALRPRSGRSTPRGDARRRRGGAAMLWWRTPGRVHTAACGKNASAAARPHTPAAPPENFKWSIQRENLKYIIALAAGDALIYYYAARLRRIRVRPPAWSPSRSSKHIDWRPSAPARLRSK